MPLVSRGDPSPLAPADVSKRGSYGPSPLRASTILVMQSQSVQSSGEVSPMSATWTGDPPWMRVAEDWDFSVGGSPAHYERIKAEDRSSRTVSTFH